MIETLRTKVLEISSGLSTSLQVEAEEKFNFRQKEDLMGNPLVVPRQVCLHDDRLKGVLTSYVINMNV